MENLIVNTVDLLIKIYVFGQIYLFWIQRFRPELQKHFAMAKSDFAAEGQTPGTWNRVYADLQIYHSTLRSLIAALPGHIYTSISSSEFLHRNFPVIMSHFGIKRNAEI